MMSEWHQVALAIEEAGGDLSPELEKRMVALEIDVPEKIDAWGFVMERMAKEADFFRIKAAEFTKMAKKFEDHCDYMSLRLKALMAENEIAELLGNETKFRLTPIEKRVEIFDETVLPIKYFDEKVVFTANKARIREDLSAGKEIDGARLEGGAKLQKTVYVKKLNKGAKDGN